MDIDQETRDKLREKQYQLQSSVVGMIVEHRVQDPAKYKQKKALRGEDLKIENIKIAETSNIPKETDTILEQTDNTLKDTNNTSKGTDNTHDINTAELPLKLEDVYQSNWVNMDKLEFDKLAWIMQENRTKIESVEGSSKQARFNIDGTLIINGPESAEIPTHLGLHHHGEEPDQAGYTIEELLCYLNSSYQRQRVLAMNVLGNIVMWAHKSSYDNIFELNIASLILNEALLSVRVNLDSSNETTVINALRCLHAFICNTSVDEILLDRAFFLFLESPSSNLWLEPKCWSDQDDPNPSTAMSFFPDDMSDGDCVKKDPIAALVERTELLTRLRYLIEAKPSLALDTDHNFHDYILEILIRIARHSPRMCAYLSGYPYLLQAIQESFLPLVITSRTLETKRPSVKALKFIRIIASADLEYKDHSIKVDLQVTTASTALKWQLSNIVQCLLVYIYIEPISDNVFEHCMQISIEALRCCSVFLQLKSVKVEFANYFGALIPNIKKHLDSIKSLEAIKRGEDKQITICDWQYAAELINVLNKLALTSKQMCSIFVPDINHVVSKWIKEIISMNMIPNLSVSLALTRGLKFLTLNDPKPFAMLDKIEKLIYKGRFLRLITRGCLPKTPILLSEKYSGSLRDAPNLPSYGSILFNRTTTQCIKLTPFFEEESSFLLFESIIDFLTITEYDRSSRRKKEEDKPEEPSILDYLIMDEALHEYLIQIRKLDSCPSSFEAEVKFRLFEQCELLTLSKALIIICQHYISLDNKVLKDRYMEGKIQCYDNLFAIAMSCISLLSSRSMETKILRFKLLSDVVLNINFYRLLVEEKCPSLDKMNYNCDTERGDILTFNGLKMIYEDCKFFDKLWAFEPLIEFYLREQKNILEPKDPGNAKPKMLTIDEDQALASKDDESSIIMVFKFISMICERSKIYSRLVLKANLEDCLCLIGTVFLSDRLFLDPRISRALRQVISTLLAECMDPLNDEYVPFQNPAKKLRGLNLSVYDFFIKLVDQYEGASYGDAAFSNFLLLFLTPKSHSSHKRYLFSEKAATCISQMRIGREEVWIPHKILFAQKERDDEIIGLYSQCARSLRDKPPSAIHMFLNFHLC